MAQAHKQITPASGGLRLAGPLSGQGLALALQKGDCLVALDGIPFVGDEATLSASSAAAFKSRVAMTFRRGDVELTVIAKGCKVGRWEKVPPFANTQRQPLSVHLMCNWEIVRATDGRYDIFAQDSSIVTLILAPIWLLQMRLWGLFAALGATIALGTVVAPLLGALLYLAASLNVWRLGPSYLRQDRTTRGLKLHAVLAAATEADAHAAYCQMYPTACFVFGVAAARAETVSRAA